MTERELQKHVTHAWSLGQVRTLAQLWGRERSQVIGKKLGKTHCACIGKANRMGLPPVDRVLVRKWMSDGFAHGNEIRSRERWARQRHV